MINETNAQFYGLGDAVSLMPPKFDQVRWKSLCDRVIDKLSTGLSLADLAQLTKIEEGRLRIWLSDATDFPSYGRRVGEKGAAEIIADASDAGLGTLEGEGINPALRCPIRVKTSVTERIFKGFHTARSLCELVEISAAPGVGKTEAKEWAIARLRKEEGVFCPVWSVTLDETCVNLKAILTLVARVVCSDIVGYDDRSEFSLSQSIIRAAEGKRGVLALDEGQHLADVMKKQGIPIINQLRSFVDRGLFGIIYFGNGEIYRRLKAGTGKNKNAYTQILSRMQDFRVEIAGFDPDGKKAPCLTKQDVAAIANAWGVTGAEEIAWCYQAAAQPGALRTMTNVFRRVLAEYDEITITTLNSIRRF